MNYSDSVKSAIDALEKVHIAPPYIPPKPPSLNEVAASFSASEVVKRLQVVFDDFSKTLNPDQEIGVALASFGVTHQVVVTSVNALGRSLIVINGFEGPQPVSLVQHLSQLNFLLIPMKRAEPDAPRRKIGFQAE